MMDSPQMSAATVGDELSKDQVLAAKVLRLVNSGFYGFRTPITTLTQAMVLLGFDVVKTLVLSASVLDILELMNKLPVGSLGALAGHGAGLQRDRRAAEAAEPRGNCRVRPPPRPGEGRSSPSGSRPSTRRSARSSTPAIASRSRRSARCWAPRTPRSPCGCSSGGVSRRSWSTRSRTTRSSTPGASSRTARRSSTWRT